MRISLEIDDDCIPFAGMDTLPALFEALRLDPRFWVKAAHNITISCPYGIKTEDA